MPARRPPQVSLITGAAKSIRSEFAYSLGIARFYLKQFARIVCISAIVEPCLARTLTYLGRPRCNEDISMNMNSPPTSAKIYQFPRRIAVGAVASSREIKPALDHRMRAVPTVDFGSGWYHEAAVQSERARKP
jgi:hypothetical protein